MFEKLTFLVFMICMVSGSACMQCAYLLAVLPFYMVSHN